MKHVLTSLSVLALAAAPLAANAAPCHDARGRFIACAKTSAAKPAPVKRAPVKTASVKTASVKPAAHPVAAHATPAQHGVVASSVHKTATKAAPKRCRIGNRFAKCGTPGAKPA